jgi:photosystem II stability/assembly factor-like uncharacterized protein
MRGSLRLRLFTGFGLMLLVLCVGLVLAQTPQGGGGVQAVQGGQGGGRAAGPPAPPPVNQSTDPLLKSFRWRSIGPASMGGRIDDIAVAENDSSTYYVGMATGGVLKTANNGTTFAPVFDTYATSSIGDIAVSPSNANIVYVGTGEANNRQSSSFGDGVYKSTDAGKTFVNVGLRETQTIARIVIHPKDPNIVYVAAVGHLFGANPERGIYKTVDGGKSWAKVKFIDDDTGFTDIVMDPADPNVLFAASYQRRRVPWGFNGGGPGSGIWKTTDAGKTWTRLTGSGLPTDPIIGRIGLDICRAKPNVIYAQIEVGASGGTGAGVQANGLPTDPNAPSQRGARAGAAGQRGEAGAKPPPPPNPTESGVWRSDDKGRTWRIVSNNNDRPMYYSQIRVDPSNPDIVYTCGAPFHRSVDGGKTFQTVQGVAHSDHHALWIDPKDGRHLLLGNDGGLDVSYDRGETWEFVNTFAVGQFYAISADMRKPYWVCGGLQDNGSFCGPSATRSSNGILNSDWFRVGSGDGFYTQQDPSDWTVVYSESQDGAVSRLDLRAGRSVSIRPRAPQAARAGAAGQGGRGAVAQAPAGEVQPGELAQQAAQMAGGRGGAPNVVPTPAAGTQYRFYWNTPILLSPHNPSIVNVGGERLFRSLNRGDTWTATIDLTNNISRFDRPIMGVGGKEPMASKHDGAAAYSNIITIAESPVLPGVIWVGTNDGNVQLSRDGGYTWKNVVANVSGVSKETHVSRVEASHFDAGTCYVSFDGHRTDDHTPYVFVTHDYGATWQSIASNLPTPGNVNVIREDPKNRNLLYLGTEYAFWISLNGGGEWKKFMTGLPTVRIDDILVHPRDNDLIVGTHGRSIYVIDDITPLQQLSDDVMKKDVHLFDVRPATAWLTDTTLASNVGGAKYFRGENPARGTAISYLLKGVPSGDVTLTISDVTGAVVRTFNTCAETATTNCAPKEAGLNRVQWNLGRDGPGGGGRAGGGRGGFGQGLDPGAYLVKLSVGGKELTTKVMIEADEIR